MLEGIQTSAAGMLPRMTEQEVIANNLANVNTTGYKRDRVVFRKTLESELGVAASEGSEVFGEEVLVDFSPGPLEKTDRPLDVAIEGSGFFTVETPNGVRYTRAGNFRLDSEGYLVTVDGYRVLGESGPILLTNDKVNINEDGEIWQGGFLVDRLRVTDFSDPRALVKEGHSLFKTADPRVTGQPAAEATIKQGYLEGSNVNPLEEMVEMMVVLRNFEAEQKAIQVQDQTLGTAVNELPRF